MVGVIVEETIGIVVTMGIVVVWGIVAAAGVSAFPLPQPDKMKQIMMKRIAVVFCSHYLFDNSNYFSCTFIIPVLSLCCFFAAGKYP
jgi:hypothetical protein